MAPTPREMFSDRNGVAVAERFEEYKELLGKSLTRADENRDAFSPGEGIVRNVRAPQGYSDQRAAERDTFETLTKSLTSDQQAAMGEQLAAMRESLAKDWDASFPESGTLSINTQLAPIDLEAPAKLLVPRVTPLRNMVPRNNTGKGSAVQFRRITGWSNSGVGNNADLMPFMSSEYPSSQSTANLPVFGGYSNTTGGVTSGGLGLRRGQKITYTADSKNFSYCELGVSDSVSWKAEYIGQGFQDIRQLSATALLWSHMMGEERALLYGRGSGTGYTGAVTQPSAPTCANASTAPALIPTASYYSVITAVASGGESVTNATQVTTSVSSGSLKFTFPTLPAGATGWNIYVGTVSGGPFYFQAFVPGGYAVWTLTAYSSTSASLPSIAGTIDTTANPNGYDGFLTVLLNSSESGYVGSYLEAGTASASLNSIGGSTFGATAQGDLPWQNAFAALYGSATEPGNYSMSTGGSSAWPWTAGTAYGNKLLASPDQIFVDGSIRQAMGQFVRTAAGGATAYRIEMQTSEATGGFEVGGIVNGIANQVDGKMVAFDVHPYMPPGASILWSKTLPVPDSEIANTFEVRNVQDYMMYPWPVIQYTYDASTYQLGTLVPYAPAWSGALVGLVP